ncbi:MAG: FAD-dependent thymidylate synthase [Oscillibacter sp.]|nr:FAD-dependent thymidylate synthase [Oscillibacter sp.]
MKMIDPTFEILDCPDGLTLLQKIERAGRVCYKSEANITPDSAIDFVRRVLKSGHESVLEHEKISVRVICDRGVSHEIVRHRIASYSQESTRYCNYSRDKFQNELTFIRPFFWNDDPEKFQIWQDAMAVAERSYLTLIEKGALPQEARGVLPNSLKTEIVVTMNIREWRHFFKLRSAAAAHPQMQEIAGAMLKAFQSHFPVVFEDINHEARASGNAG